MGYESLPHQEWWFNGIIIGLYLRNHGPCGDLRIFGTIEWGCEMLEDGIGIPRLINFAPIFYWVYSGCNCPFMQGWWLSSLFDDDNPIDNWRSYVPMGGSTKPSSSGWYLLHFTWSNNFFWWILYYISELHPLVIHGKFSLAKEHPACWKRKVICQEMVFQSHIIFDSRRVLHGTPPFPATRQANQPGAIWTGGGLFGCWWRGGSGVDINMNKLVDLVMLA